jgi:hypothetical protein
LELTIDELARDTWARDPGWCRARLAEFCEHSHVDAGPRRREAALWFLLDCPLPDGQTPIWRMRQERAERAVELLARSEIRAWRVEAPPLAVCPQTRERVRLERRGGAAIANPSRQNSAPEPGAIVVGRSIPLGPKRWLLLGPVSCVAARHAPGFERLIGSLHAPVGEFWRVHGGVLARAALEWPSPVLGIAA